VVPEVASEGRRARSHGNRKISDSRVRLRELYSPADVVESKTWHPTLQHPDHAARSGASERAFDDAPDLMALFMTGRLQNPVELESAKVEQVSRSAFEVTQDHDRQIRVLAPELQHLLTRYGFERGVDVDHAQVDRVADDQPAKLAPTRRVKDSMPLIERRRQACVRNSVWK